MSDHASRRPPGSGRNGDFQAAVTRLERAVQELVALARDQFSDRAASFIDETTHTLERELDRRRPRTGRPRTAGRRSSRAQGWPRRHVGRGRRLYRDPERQKIAGVCAGLARYYGVEPWVVRCIAVTGLLFFPSIVFPAYWILFFVMDKPPRVGDDGVSADGGAAHRPPEFEPRRAPRHRLRDVHADLSEVELRLRRMEGYVTSDRYELQRELNRINGESGAGRV